LVFHYHLFAKKGLVAILLPPIDADVGYIFFVHFRQIRSKFIFPLTFVVQLDQREIVRHLKKSFNLLNKRKF